MSVYKRGNVYWYDFWFRGQRIRQSSGLRNKTAAVRAEAIRKAELAERRAGIARYGRCPTYEDFVNTEFLPWSRKEQRVRIYVFAFNESSSIAFQRFKRMSNRSGILISTC